MIIKAIEAKEEILQVINLESRIWGEEMENTLPVHLLTAIAQEGGLLLGAFLDGSLIGFTLGWLGTSVLPLTSNASDQLKLVSHMTGVLAAYRDQRIGFQLKLAQREWALDRGLDLITWTYDPLESRNGYFNIHLLGCRSRTYLEDYYGEMTDQLSAGIPSDRLRVEWWIKAEEVRSALMTSDQGSDRREQDLKQRQRGCRLMNPPIRKSKDLLRPGPILDIDIGSCYLIEIPADFQMIKKRDSDLGLAWRLHIRDALQSVFNAGYMIADFIYLREPEPSCFYVLEGRDEN